MPLGPAYILISSVFSILQFVFSPIWGSLSDRLGRRTVLRWTVAGTALGYLIWVLSGSFWMFLLSRLVSGAFSGNLSVATAAVADVTTRTERSKAMGLVGAAFGLGRVTGPTIGAYTAHINLLNDNLRYTAFVDNAQQQSGASSSEVDTEYYVRTTNDYYRNVLQSPFTALTIDHTRLGNQTPFYYQDPDDNAVTAQGFGTGTGAQTVFQLYRTVGSGTIYNYLEPVLVLRNNPSIYVNGTLQTLTTNYTIGNNGVITFVTAPASGAVLTWTGGYLFLCAFDDDNLDPRQDDNAYWSVGKLNFHSIKA
jgi:hypothetical protein